MDITLSDRLAAFLLRNIDKIRNLENDVDLVGDFDELHRQILNEQIIHFPTSIPDINYLLMMAMDDDALRSICRANKQTAELCRNSDFWLNRLLRWCLKAGIHMKYRELIEYQPDYTTWKQVYLKLANPNNIPLIVAIGYGLYPIVVKLWELKNDIEKITNLLITNPQKYKKYFVGYEDLLEYIERNDKINSRLKRQMKNVTLKSIWNAVNIALSHGDDKIFYYAMDKEKMESIKDVLDNNYLDLENLLIHKRYDIISYLSQLKRHPYDDYLLYRILISNLNGRPIEDAADFLQKFISRDELIGYMELGIYVDWDLLQLIMKMYSIPPRQVLTFWQSNYQDEMANTLDRFIEYCHLDLFKDVRRSNLVIPILYNRWNKETNINLNYKFPDEYLQSAIDNKLAKNIVLYICRHSRKTIHSGKMYEEYMKEND